MGKQWRHINTIDHKIRNNSFIKINIVIIPSKKAVMINIKQANPTCSKFQFCYESCTFSKRRKTLT